MILFAMAAIAGCLPLPRGAQNVTAADLRLDGVAGDIVLSLAPMPGLQRTFHFAELRQIAARFHLPEFDEEICVERPLAPVDQTAALQAMRREMPEAQIDLLEMSRQAAPEGDLVFKRSGLRANAAGAIWFGVVRYAPNREYTIWAKVRVTVQGPRVVAVTNLAAGKPIGAAQVKLETASDFPPPQPLATALEETVGRYPKALILAGAKIRRDALEPPADVRQGDVVEVEVASGNARLRFEGRAAASGAMGATIPVLNPATSRRFEGRISGKDKVLVEAQ